VYTTEIGSNLQALGLAQLAQPTAPRVSRVVKGHTPSLLDLRPTLAQLVALENMGTRLVQDLSCCAPDVPL
jgi:hypothetical protein